LIPVANAPHRLDGRIASQADSGSGAARAFSGGRVYSHLGNLFLRLFPQNQVLLRESRGYFAIRRTPLEHRRTRINFIDIEHSGKE